MAFDPFSLITIPLTWVADKALKHSTKKQSKHSSSKKAIRGDSPFEQGSFDNLLRTELLNLSESRTLPMELRSQQFREWLQSEEIVPLFARVFWARWAEREDISKSVEEQLAINYEQNTGETRKLAAGRIRLAIDYIYGQLKATDDRQHIFQTALTQYCVGQIYSLTEIGPPKVPGEGDLPLFRSMAKGMLDAGKHIWRLPQIVAPLDLEMRVQDNDEAHQINISKLIRDVEFGENIILYGLGGIGKTTLALTMCESCLGREKRIPLYVDVAAWASKDIALFEYIEVLPAAKSNGITSAMLTKLAENGKLVIILNGWNEVSAKSKRDCGRVLTELKVAAEALNIVVVSRSDKDIPTFNYSKKIEVRGLSWEGQQKIVSEELDEKLAGSLLDFLGRDNHFRHSARSPLILRGLISYFSRGGDTENLSNYDLLGASIETFETDAQRIAALSTEPIDSNQTAYLEKIACFLTDQQTTTCSREDALKVFSSAAKQLYHTGQISTLPNLSAILDVLSNHHLLHLDSDIVRFAHQRFQEYFAARRILCDCLETTSSSSHLNSLMNKVSWDDVFELVAEKLRGKDNVHARVKLIRISTDIDLGLACDLIRTCAFSRTDDLVLHDWIADHVNELVDSSIDEIKDLGTAYQIASCLPVFGENLWALLEDANHQNRLKTYRLNSTGISILQLGDEAEVRIDAWPLDRRVEFINETAKNPDNYEYIVRLARFESIPEIKSAAVSIFPWEYPASEVPIKSLFDAPIEVLTDHNVISCIQYYSEFGDDLRKVWERIKSFSPEKIPSSAQVELSLKFPDEFGSIYQDAVLERLADHERYMYDVDLLTIAQTYFPERMLSLAKELTFAKEPPGPQDNILRYQPFPPMWVGEFLQQTSNDIKHEIFDRMLTILSQGKDIDFLDGKIIGPLASSDQVKKCLDFLLLEEEKEYRDISDKDRLRHKKIEETLSNAEGDILLEVVRKFGRELYYDEAATLLKFLNHRITSDDPAGVIKQWLPTIDDVDALISLLAEKEETAEDHQNLVRIHLSSIASHVDPHRYMPFIIECCQHHLDIWDIYRDRMLKWTKERMGRRPQNPMYSEDLKSALARCGEAALPELLKFIDHPEAMEIVVGSIVRIVNEPWSCKKERFWPGAISAMQEGKERRKQNLVNRQPGESLQLLTDEVAIKLGRKLTKTVTEYLEQKNQNEHFNIRAAESPVGHLAALLAGISSPEVIEPINHALSSGLMNIYHTVNVIQGLLRQGLSLDDEGVITRLEDCYQESKSKTWYGDHEQYELSALIQLLLSVEQMCKLSWPVKYYLEQWREFSNIHQILQNIRSINLDAAQSILELLAPEITSTKNDSLSKEYAGAVVYVFTKKNLASFFTVLADGSFFKWCSSGWNLKRLAPDVINALDEEPDQIKYFVSACRKAQSPIADVLAAKVLSKIEDKDSLLEEYLIDAIDAKRAVNSNMPAFHAIANLFKLKIPTGSEHYKIAQRSNNSIRRKLLDRAKRDGEVADGCKQLLAYVELKRREYGRPIDELRHPSLDDGTPWDETLTQGSTH